MAVLKNINSVTNLHNTIAMPRLGLGTFRASDGVEVQQAIQWALAAGYRHIDTAAYYQNEAGVGTAVHSSGINRSDIFITSKVWNSSQGYDETIAAFDESMQRLNLDLLDLFLVHWPVPGKYKQTWRALEDLYTAGKIRAIGVSNFHIHHLQDLLQDASITPMVNQIELHPYLQQSELHNFCRAHRIQMEAWSPIMQGQVTEVPELIRLGKKRSKTPAQIALRWILQRDIVAIPKSTRQERIIENADLFDFELDPEDMESITRLDRGQRFGPDPDNVNF